MSVPLSVDRLELGSEDFADLMKGLEEGSEVAAQKVVELYGPHILRIIRRSLTTPMRQKFDSIDFVQSVWLALFREPGKLTHSENPDHFVAQLCLSARHKVLNEIRKRTKTQKANITRERQLETSAVPSKLPSPSQVFLAKEQLERLMGSRPESHKSIIQLRMSGHTLREIASELSISQRTVQRVLKSIEQDRQIED